MSDQTVEQTAENAPSGGTAVQEAELPEASEQAAAEPAGQIGILLDTTMPVAVRLGQARMAIRDILALGPGSVVKLDKQVGEPLELFLQDIKFATGQLVVVGDRLAVRITEILSPAGAAAGEGDG
jgi:flagellar motor switch protein FliN/FliY